MRVMCWHWLIRWKIGSIMARKKLRLHEKTLLQFRVALERRREMVDKFIVDSVASDDKGHWLDERREVVLAIADIDVIRGWLS